MNKIILLAAALFSVWAQAAYMPKTLSTGSANWHVESARLGFSSVCSLDAQSGSWLSSPSNSSTGACTITMSGWSAIPACTVTIYTTTGIIPTVYIRNITTTSINITMQDTTGAGQNWAFNLICMGPR